MSNSIVSINEQIFDDFCLGTLSPYENFMMALKSKETKRQYPKLLKMFLDCIKLDGYLSFDKRVDLLYEKSITEKNWLATNTFIYILFHEKRVERKEIVAGTLKNHVKIIRVFCRMNDIENLVPWNKIKITMPKVKQFADDRSPILEEIRKLVEFNDPRIKSLIYLMSSSGIRLGAIDYLRWKDVVSIYDEDDYTKVIAAKLIVYPGEPEQYYTFISPEAYSSLLNWMEFRESHGEIITGDSWVFRNLWETRIYDFLN
jgi:integrase